MLANRLWARPIDRMTTSEDHHVSRQDIGFSPLHRLKIVENGSRHAPPATRNIAADHGHGGLHLVRLGGGGKMAFTGRSADWASKMRSNSCRHNMPLGYTMQRKALVMSLTEGKRLGEETYVPHAVVGFQ